MELANTVECWAGLEDLRPVLNVFLARRCRDDGEIDDIVQETLLRAARYRGSLSQPERLRAWVLRIAANCLRDHLRREGRLPRSDSGDDVFDRIEGREDVPGETPDDRQLLLEGEVVEKDLALKQVLRAMQRLREDDQLVLDSYYVGERTCSETAKVCELAPDLVKCRLFRARKRLRRTLRRRMGRSWALLGEGHGALELAEPA
jgi:RNA polymerase sigma-70 factor (ECF subfamily)